MATTLQGPPRQGRALGAHIDVYECECGSRLVVTADHLTFRQPPPMDCSNCHASDMAARRFTEAKE